MRSWFCNILALLAFLFALEKVALSAQPEASPKVLIKEIKITGAEVIEPAELEPIVAPFIGKEMDLSDLQKVANLITEEYQRKGFNLARAIIPEQDITAGVAEIRVLEARVGQITIQGNRYYSDAFIRRAFARVIRDKAIKQSSLEKSLLVLNDQYPDVKATAALKAGAEPGTTDIVVSAEDRLPVHVAFDYNNFGVRQVSRHIFGAQLDLVDPWFGSFVSVRRNTGIDPELTTLTRVSSGLPVNNYGTMLGGYWTEGNFDVGGDLARLNLQGESRGWGLAFTHPFIRTRFHNLSGDIGFELRDSTLLEGRTRRSRDRIRLVRAGFVYDSIIAGGRNLVSLNIFRGLGEAFGGMKDDNPLSSRIGFSRKNPAGKGADGDFTYGNITLLRLQPITSFLRAILKTSGQITSSALVASEQFAIGGPDSVRGYPSKELVADSGFNASVEARILPIPENEMLQLALFVDYGLIQQRRPPVGQEKFQSLLGYGTGLRLLLPYNFNFRFDVGFPVFDALPHDPIKNSAGKRQIYYFAASIRF